MHCYTLHLQRLSFPPPPRPFERHVALCAHFTLLSCCLVLLLQCVAMDRHSHTMTHPDVHAALPVLDLQSLTLLSLCFFWLLLQCFAMDRDSHTMTRPEVHAVYVLLPSNKAPMGVVEQPDGGYAFADARQQQQQQQQQGVPYTPAPYAPPPSQYATQPAPGYPNVPRE